jgi:hypothetical protein
MSKFLISFIIFINLKTIFSQSEKIFIQARSKGFNLNDPNDPFFHDICLQLEIFPKDVTLEYRRKNFFNSGKPRNDVEFQRPLRNDTKECFFINNSINNIFGNISIILFIIFMIQFFLIINVLVIKVNVSIQNSPYNKLMKINQKNNKKNEKYINIINDPKNPYSKFTSEEKKVNEEQDNNINNKENTKELMINESQRPMFIKQDNQVQDDIKNENQYNDNDEPQQASSAAAKIDLVQVKEEQDNLDNKKQNNLDEVDIPKEKSTDNYTFGFNFGTKYNFNNNIKNNNTNNENEEENEKKQNALEKKEKMKRIKEIYEEINPIKKKINENINNNTHNNMNSDTTVIFTSQEQEKKVYVREEFFYFKYLLARIEDKRTLSQIYFDLLEQTQIIFKFCTVPFNIYEDRKLQAIYYLTKIHLYFLINSLFINNAVINDIYDNKNNIKSDIIRSLKVTLITFFICFFLYKLTNLKRVLIRRRYKLINLKISNKLLNAEIIELTKRFCNKFLRHKILIFFTLVFVIVAYSYYICYSFCKVYQKTQILLLECVTFCIVFSQMIPFIVCWIPAYIRKKSLDLKNAKLYDLTKKVELFFIP